MWHIAACGKLPQANKGAAILAIQRERTAFHDGPGLSQRLLFLQTYTGTTAALTGFTTLWQGSHLAPKPGCGDTRQHSDRRLPDQ